MWTMASAFYPFRNIVDVDDGSAFVQRMSQKCTHN